MIIYKYQVELGQFSISMPMGAKILCTKWRYQSPQMWALVPDPDSSLLERRDFRVFATGEHIPEEEYGSVIYIGTFFTPNNVFVWHLFEVIT